MVYIKCLNVKRSKLFYICSSLVDEDLVKLVDQLHDNKCILTSVKQTEIEEINPYLEEITDCFYFPLGGYIKTEVENIINSEKYIGMKLFL